MLLRFVKKKKIPVYEKNFKLKDVLNADEAFITGTFANIIPVKQVNNKKFDIKQNRISSQIRELYLSLINQ